MSDDVDCRRRGIVSVWIATFPSVEAAEVYFGIPDEIGVYLPPEGFATDLGIGDLPAECLEVNVEQVSPRPLEQLLADATFSEMFMDQAAEAAQAQGISEAQGVALLYDFDYEALPGWRRAAGAVQFIGSFPLSEIVPPHGSKPRPDPRLEIREIADDVL